MSNWFTDLLGAGAGYYNQDEATKAALELGERGAQEAARLGTETADMAEFKPFTVRTGLGTATTTPEGGYGLQLDPRQQAIQDTAFGSAYGFMSGIGQDPMSRLLGGQALQAYQGLGPSALTGAGTAAYQGLGADPLTQMGAGLYAGFQPSALTTQGATAYGDLSPSALRGTGIVGLGAVGGDPMQREILAQARERFQDIGTDPRQQALLSQAKEALGRAAIDPSQAQADLYGQIRATQQPEEERQRLALEERMLAQGRLGLSSSAYGGASPELLAQETARQEAMSRANLSARQQAMQEQQQAYGQGLGLLGQASGLRAQDLAEATGLLGAGYTPEQRELARAQAQLSGGLSEEQADLARVGAQFGAGMSQDQAALARAGALLSGGLSREQADLSRAGALFGAGMTQEQADLARAGTLQQASYMPRAQDLAMAQGMLGIGYTPQQQMLEALGIGTKTAGLADIGRRTGAELFGQLGQTGLETLMQGAELAQGLEASKRQSLTEALLGRQPTMQEQLLANYLGVDAPEGDSGFMSYLGFGDAPTPQWIKDLNPFD
jgi:hypothetical protein